MLIPVNVDVPMTRLPVANWGLIAAICGISIFAWGDSEVFDKLAGIEYIDPTAGMSDEEIEFLHR